MFLAIALFNFPTFPLYSSPLQVSSHTPQLPLNHTHINTTKRNLTCPSCIFAADSPTLHSIFKKCPRTKPWCPRDMLNKDSWTVFRLRLKLIRVKLAIFQVGNLGAFQLFKICHHFSYMLLWIYTFHPQSLQCKRETCAVKFQLCQLMEFMYRKR